MKKLSVTLSLLVFAVPAFAADWPQFRGPGGLGVANEKNLPFAWSSNGKNFRWKAELPGRGLSNPIVTGGKVFVTASSGWQQNRLHVICFDEKSGEKLWERQFWATGTTQSHQKTCMAAPTPVTDGEHIYALFATFDLAALDTNGNLLWFRSLTGDYPTIGNNVGMASSPIVWKDLVILAVENVGESFALAIDKKSGQNRWRVPRNRQINWATPLLIEVNGQEQVVFQSPNELSAHDPASGKKLWKYTDSGFATIPSPVTGDGLIYAQGRKFLALRPGSKDQEPELLWESRKLRCGYGTPLYYHGSVFTLHSKGIIRCADAQTGKLEWDLRLDGDFAASPVVSAGKLYMVNEEGTTFVMDTQKANVYSVNPLRDRILATPAIANGAIYLRSDDYLYCIGGKK